jgi:hypothetical protein
VIAAAYQAGEFTGVGVAHASVAESPAEIRGLALGDLHRAGLGKGHVDRRGIDAATSRPEGVAEQAADTDCRIALLDDGRLGTQRGVDRGRGFAADPDVAESARAAMIVEREMARERLRADPGNRLLIDIWIRRPFMRTTIRVPIMAISRLFHSRAGRMALSLGAT